MTDNKKLEITAESLVIPGRKLNEKFVNWLLHVLTPDECAEWIAWAESQQFKPASLLSDQITKNPHRTNDRLLVFDAIRSAVLFERLQPHLPATWTDASDKSAHMWTLTGLNDRLSFLRYRNAEQYGKHVDVPYEDEKTGRRSFITVQLYLNEGFTGGETRFDQEVGFKSLVERTHLDVVPKTGAVLMFEHELTHEGRPVTSGTKYTVRVDAMYERVVLSTNDTTAESPPLIVATKMSTLQDQLAKTKEPVVIDKVLTGVTSLAPVNFADIETLLQQHSRLAPIVHRMMDRYKRIHSEAFKHFEQKQTVVTLLDTKGDTLLARSAGHLQNDGIRITHDNKPVVSLPAHPQGLELTSTVSRNTLSWIRYHMTLHKDFARAEARELAKRLGEDEKLLYDFVQQLSASCTLKADYLFIRLAPSEQPSRESGEIKWYVMETGVWKRQWCEPCAACQTPDCTKRCPKCGVTFYCSDTCYRTDHVKHQKMCRAGDKPLYANFLNMLATHHRPITLVQLPPGSAPSKAGVRVSASTPESIKLRQVAMDSVKSQLAATTTTKHDNVDPKRPWTYVMGAIPPQLASSAMAELSAIVTKTHEPEIKSRPHQPLFSFFSHPSKQPYRYFTRTVIGAEFPPILYQLCELAKTLCPATPFDAAFVNLYRSGADHVPLHRDTTHGIEHPIVSFSLYPETASLRTLEIHDLHGTLVEAIAMAHGSAVLMHVGMQDTYMHMVPPDKSTTPRINITFRVHHTLDPIKPIKSPFKASVARDQQDATVNSDESNQVKKRTRFDGDADSIEAIFQLYNDIGGVWLKERIMPDLPDRAPRYTRARITEIWSSSATSDFHWTVDPSEMDPPLIATKHETKEQLYNRYHSGCIRISRLLKNKTNVSTFQNGWALDYGWWKFDSSRSDQESQTLVNACVTEQTGVIPSLSALVGDYLFPLIIVPA